MSPEELDKARAEEAWRTSGDYSVARVATIAARLAREGWTPPPPVDPDLIAVRGVLALISNSKNLHNAYLEGKCDDDRSFQMALAAYKAGREVEAERAKVLVEPAEAIVNRAVKGTGANDVRWPHILKAARRLEEGLTAYKAGKEAAQ
jgi:hypothetical protein